MKSSRFFERNQSLLWMGECKCYWSQRADRLWKYVFQLFSSVVLRRFHALWSFISTRISRRMLHGTSASGSTEKRICFICMYNILDPTGHFYKKCTSTPWHLRLSQGVPDGFKCYDAKSQNLRVFIEVCCFLRDYLASTQIMDVMKHISRAPCNHCTFRHCSKGNGSNFSHWTSVHSGNCSLSIVMSRTIWFGLQSFRNED